VSEKLSITLVIVLFIAMPVAVYFVHRANVREVDEHWPATSQKEGEK
jgi:hypothetical protein